MKDRITNLLPTECPWRDTLYWYDSIDSTNNRAKALAKQGAASGTIILAGQQTAGRGRLGRSFCSMPELGIYLSVILRPNCPAEQLMHLTCAAAVSVCDGIEAVCRKRPGIKWINDLVMNQKKLGGILTELSIDPATTLVDYAIVGIGINCRHRSESFPETLRPIATSLALEGFDISCEALTAAILTALFRMSTTLLSDKAQIMERYRRDCITLGKDIIVHRGDQKRPGKAITVDDDGALRVLFEDGHLEAVQSGEVSVRGLYSYI